MAQSEKRNPKTVAACLLILTGKNILREAKQKQVEAASEAQIQQEK